MIMKGPSGNNWWLNRALKIRLARILLRKESIVFNYIVSVINDSI